MKLGDMGVNSRKSKNVDLSQKQIEKRFISEKDILSSFLFGCILVTVFNWLFKKNADHNIAKVEEPCNVDACANNPGLIMTMFCPWLCVRL